MSQEQHKEHHMNMHAITPPSPEEINQLRRDASEGDPNAAAFFRHSEDTDAALEAWRAKRNSESTE
jgi:hypothetical protein